MTANAARHCLIAAACIGMPILLSAQEPIRAPLQDRLEVLADQSSWMQDTTLGDTVARRGAYPIGNGRVFATCGTGTTANELRGLTGPRFQTANLDAADGQFGSLHLEVRSADGTAIPLPSQRVRRVRGAPIVITEDASDRLVLRTTTFAPPDETSIVRIIEIENRGSSPSVELELVVRAPAFSAEGDRLVARHGDGSRAAAAALVLEGGTVVDGELTWRLGSLAPAGQALTTLALATVGGRDAPTAAAVTVDAAAARGAATIDAWRQRLQGTLSFDSDHVKLQDLVQDWKINLCILRDAESGVFVPAEHRRVASVLENNGAMAAALRLGLWEEAKGVLEFWWNATRLTGEVPDEVPLDLDFGGIDTAGTAQSEFWQQVRVPPGGAATFILLQHFWYWRATADTALIERHWPLIDVCLKRAKRGADDMLTFSGNEPWLRLARALGEDAADPALFVSEDPSIGRQSWSFENSVLFLLSVQAVGELADGLDEMRHPERWSDGPPEDRPSATYSRRSFDVLRNVEKRFWLEDAGLFAPAVSPVGGEPHRFPIAEANLMPLWAGWTFPTGEKSRDNLRNSLARLWRLGTRLGSTPTVGYSTGDLQGRLLTALAERDGQRRLDALDELLAQAEPAGEWASYLDPEGRAFGIADRARPERLSPGVGGTNLDAALFAITGIRHVAVPNWDDDDVRLELRLPHGASYVTIRGARKDRRELNLFFRRERSMLTEEEQEANDKLQPEKRRDPHVPHDRLRFVVELAKGAPRKGYYDVGLNAEGTMFVRYLQTTAPTSPDQNDLRKIEEMEFSTPDKEPFFPAGPTTPVSITRQVARAATPDVLVLTCRPSTADTVRGDGVTVFDTGLPLTLDDLRAELLDAEGQLVHPRLFLDWAFDAAPPGTWTPTGFWSGEPWRATLEAYRAAGGVVLDPGFVRAAEWTANGEDWQPATVAADGRIEFPVAATIARFSVSANADGDAVLRLGATSPVSIVRDGMVVLDGDGKVPAMPDQAAALLRLGAGRNAFEIRLGPIERTRPCACYVRITDSRGLPIAPGD